MRKTYFIIIASLLVPLITNAATTPEAIVVCYPGGAVNIKDANGAMNTMLRLVERIGQWQENSFNSLFSTKTDECRKLIAENEPRFAITSLGVYLELRDQHHFVPIAQPTVKGLNTERYRVMVQKNKYKNLVELKGKSLGGTVLEEPTFVGKIVFAGKYDPSTFFALKTSNQAIRTLRALDKGELDAVILNEQQFGGLLSLQLTTLLEIVFTSEEIPLMGLVANNTTTTEEERTRFSKALVEMCSDAEGKKLCESFGVDSFSSVDASNFDPMIKLWTKEQ